MLNNYITLYQHLRSRLYFSVTDIAHILSIKPSSANMLASRYTKKGLFLRVKKDMYIFPERWHNFKESEIYQIANLIKVPSYISFMTALTFYEITTQCQQNLWESATLGTSQRTAINSHTFTYYKLKKPLFFDFIKHNNFFIATKEKALVDAIYLYSLGKYRLDLNSLDIKKLDKSHIKKLITFYPDRTKSVIRTLCKI
ncbi:MAG: hypothetical protein N2201_04955 [candidate division WOR-3 bacterium]|nr:hypothetical protein [candidate division WOR-3 bacterium]